MARPAFDPKELEPTGELYVGMAAGFDGMPMPPDPVLKRPIPVKQNLRMLLEGKRPYWIPTGGFFAADLQGFRPRINPDNIANHQIFDGGPEFSYEEAGIIKTSRYGDHIHSWWFDLDWITTDVGGAMFLPGAPKIPDITEWEKYVQMPDLDSPLMDWDSLAEQNAAYLGTDKMNQLGIQCGLWERLMALMDATDACMALYDEDLKPHTHRFLDAYCNFLIDYIKRIKDRVDIECVCIHEDWAHQRGPFFSAETASEMLVPYVKRITDFLHANDMFYEIHMCGATEKLIPCYLEAGVDIWSAIQPLLYDSLALVKEYKDEPLAFCVMPPRVTNDASDEEMREAAQKFVEDYKDCNLMLMYFDMDPEAPMYHFGYQNAIYEFSRKAFQGCED